MPSLPSTPSRVPSEYETKSSILYLHSLTVRRMEIVRLSGDPLIQDSHREYKLYHSVWESPIMCVAWKISPSLGCYVDNESIPLKILFISILKPSSSTSTNPYLPLRRAYIFTFMLSHHLLIKKAPVGEHCCHLHSL